jgi:hypothetical protein
MIDVLLALMLFFVAMEAVLAKVLPGGGAGRPRPVLSHGWGRH